MIIRKLFKFENAHIVRGCSTIKCRSSLHGHSYKVEVLFSSDFLDNGQMVYDFGLTKQHIKELVESFDHAITLWSKDANEYKNDMKKHSQRWIELPVSPSAEQFSRVIFVLLDALLNLTCKQNGEKEVLLYSIIVHETDTGYAQCFRQDAYSEKMGAISLEEIIFSDSIKESFSHTTLLEEIVAQKEFVNPTSV
jgi:6-pyruvoyltetrahydropterin/6-carboxytetrahydropterin synthase